jgi:hypothetical protein
VLFLSYFLDILEQPAFSDMCKRIVCILVPALLPGSNFALRQQLYALTASELAQKLSASSLANFKMPDINGLRQLINIEREAFGLIGSWMAPRSTTVAEGARGLSTSGTGGQTSSPAVVNRDQSAAEKAVGISSVKSPEKEQLVPAKDERTVDSRADDVDIKPTAGSPVQGANSSTVAQATSQATSPASSTENVANMGNLFIQAFSTPLNPQQQQQLVAFIRSSTNWLVTDSARISQHVSSIIVLCAD